MTRSRRTTTIGLGLVALAVLLAWLTPRARHEATVDRPTIPMNETKWQRAHSAFDGNRSVLLLGRQWLILRTGGEWW